MIEKNKNNYFIDFVLGFGYIKNIFYLYAWIHMNYKKTSLLLLIAILLLAGVTIAIYRAAKHFRMEQQRQQIEQQEKDTETSHKVGRLRKELNDVQADLENANDQLERKQNELDNLQSKYDELRRNYDKLQTALDGYRCIRVY